jgi:hypothetical protein
MPIQAAFGNGSLRSFGVNVSPKKRIGANVAVTYLILAGGGGSSWQAAGASGGGGAGGLITGVQNTSGGVRLSVVVGAGGTGYQNGSNSSVTRYTLDEGVWTNIESAGGGGGGIELGDPSAPQAALPGGSGGGGGGRRRFPLGGPAARSGPGAAGYTPQGNNGGNGGAAGQGASGGGGGAGGAGGNASGDTVGGNGGAAYASPISGTPVNYGGGGAGGCQQNGGSATQGAQASPGGAVNNPAAAYGGGGAGGILDSYTPGVQLSGGSGVVIFRSVAKATYTEGNPTETQVGSEWVYTFTGSGVISIGSI